MLGQRKWLKFDSEPSGRRAVQTCPPKMFNNWHRAASFSLTCNLPRQEKSKRWNWKADCIQIAVILLEKPPNFQPSYASPWRRCILAGPARGQTPVGCTVQ